jgi:hypothetical protein
VRQRSQITIFVGFVFLSILSTWPLVGHLGSALPSDLGDPLLNAWILGWDADRLRHGFQGLWDAPILYPNIRTLAFSEHLLGLAVPLAPIVWLSRNPILAYNVAFILSYVLAAIGMFLLAEQITGRTDAALLAALAFAFGPARTDQISHLQVLTSGWMPMCLWALHRYFATFSARALALFAAAFALQALSNGYFLYFLALPSAVVLAFECVTRRNALKARGLKTILELGSAGAAILLAMAPIAKVYLDVRRTYGFRRSYGDLVNFSADVASYFHVAEPARLWSHFLAISLSAERQLFPGLTVLVLAASAFWSPRSPIPDPRSQEGTRKYVWCYLTIATLAFLLSLGAEPSAWGHRILPFSPYLVLARIVPGLDGLRAPARFSVVVLLGLSVLAAIGYKKWVRRHPTPFLVLAVLIIAEGWSAPIRLAAFDAQGREAERPLYTWLAAKPPGGVLELPIKSWDVAPTLTYQYATLFHHHQIVNGYSGYGSTMQAWLGGSASPLRELATMGTTIDALRAAGIRFVIVHRDDFDDQNFADLTLSRLRELGPQITDIKNAGSATAFELSGDASQPTPLDVAHLTPIPSSQFHATASDGGADRLALAFDNDVDSRWYSGHQQRGDEWIRIDFDRPTRVGGVRLRLAGRSLGDYPRNLVIESIDEQGHASALRSSPVLTELTQGLLSDGAYPWIDVSVPPSVAPSKAIVLKQTGTTRSWYWSIHEIQLLER